VNDLSRFCIALGIVRVGLRLRERAQRRRRRVRPEHELLKRRDQRVATEYRHEPRQAGRGDHSLLRPAQPQGRKVGERACPRALERRFAPLQHGHRAPPRVERRVPLAPVVAQLLLECRAAERRRSVQEPLHRDQDPPARAGLEPQAVASSATDGLVRCRREIDERARREALIRELDRRRILPPLRA
jgi:hypothetical protein